MKSVLVKLIVLVIPLFLVSRVLGQCYDRYIMENQQIKVIVELPGLSLKFESKASLQTFQTANAPFAKVIAVKQKSPEVLNLKAELQSDSHCPIDIDFYLEEKALRIVVSGPSVTPITSDIEFPGIIASQANDFLIIPRATGVMVSVKAPFPFGSFATYAWKSTMPFVGVTNQKEGYMVATDDQWDAEFRFKKPEGSTNTSFQLHQKPAKSALSYQRTIYLMMVNDGYREMCAWYRVHAEKLGYAKSFSQKKAENSNIDKLIGAVDFWPIKMNVRPSFVDSLRLLGVDKAIWHLTGGWGMRNFSVLIDSINTHGYLSGRYDIFTDVWPNEHPEWTNFRREGYPDDVIVRSDGQLRKGWLAYPQKQPFQGYYTCAATHLAYAQKHIPEDLKINRYNSRFIDVEMASSLEECYSSDHPVTRRADAHARNEVMNYVKNELKLVSGVEEAHDYAFPNVDYSEGTMTILPAKNAGYDWSNPLDTVEAAYLEQNISPELRIPLHGLVYHDVHIPSWYTGDGASKVPSCREDKNLWNILYGSMPLYMPPSRAYWNAHLEEFISGFHLISAVTRNVGYAKMTDHRFVTEDRKVQMTRFDNDWIVVVNFDTIARMWNGQQLAPKGFYASEGKEDASSKLIVDGHPLEWSQTGARLFFNPCGKESHYKGLRTSHSVFVESGAGYLLVSFIGDQNYLDLKAADLPIGIKKIIGAVDYHSGAKVPLTRLNDGWVRLNRSGEKRFYKVLVR